MRKINKTLALVLALITVLSAFSIVPFTASAKETSVVSTSAKTPTSGECGKNAKWKIDSKGVLTIYGKGEIIETDELTICIQEKAKEVKISNGITKLPNRLFMEGSKIEKITVANSVKTLEEAVFFYCNKLKSVTIGNGVTKIPYCSFLECPSLQSVKLGTGVKSIETNAFDSCVKLNTITIDKKNKNLCSVDGVVYTKNKKKIVLYPQGKKNTSYSILKGTKTIGKCAFAFGVNLKKVTIPTTVTSIENSAFIHCTKLKKLTVPSSVKKIGYYAYGYRFNFYGGEFDDEITTMPIKGCAIYGKSGSSANRYCVNFKVKFVKVK